MPLPPKNVRGKPAAGCRPGCAPGCQPADKPPLPSLARRGVNFVKASVQHVAQGRPQRPDATKLAILEQCAANECGLYRGDLKKPKCAHRDCGCNLAAKAGWADQQCPEGYWLAEERAEQARQLAASGNTPAQIAAELDCQLQAVRIALAGGSGPNGAENLAQIP